MTYSWYCPTRTIFADWDEEVKLGTITVYEGNGVSTNLDKMVLRLEYHHPETFKNSLAGFVIRDIV